VELLEPPQPVARTTMNATARNAPFILASSR
jgi:hypothetical protein